MAKPKTRNNAIKMYQYLSYALDETRPKLTVPFRRFNMLRVECNRCKRIFDGNKDYIHIACHVPEKPIYCPRCKKQWNQLRDWRETLATKASATVKRKFEAKKKEWLDCAIILTDEEKKDLEVARKRLGKLIADNMFTAEEMDKGGG